MHVEDGLAGAAAGVEDEPELAVGELVGEPLRDRDELGEQRRVARRRARRRRGTRRVFGVTTTCTGAFGAMSWNAMTRSVSATICAGISRAAMRSKRVGSAAASVILPS